MQEVLVTRSPQPSEHQIQSAFVQWCAVQSRRYPALNLAYAIPNGANKSIAAAMKFKREGLRSGAPDWHLPVAIGGFIGFWIEFKALRKKPNDAQKAYHALLRMYGHRVEVYDRLEDAIAGTLEYLKGVPTGHEAICGDRVME